MTNVIQFKSKAQLIFESQREELYDRMQLRGKSRAEIIQALAELDRERDQK